MAKRIAAIFDKEITDELFLTQDILSKAKGIADEKPGPDRLERLSRLSSVLERNSFFAPVPIPQSLVRSEQAMRQIRQLSTLKTHVKDVFISFQWSELARLTDAQPSANSDESATTWTTFLTMLRAPNPQLEILRTENLTLKQEKAELQKQLRAQESVARFNSMLAGSSSATLQASAEEPVLKKKKKPHKLKRSQTTRLGS